MLGREIEEFWFNRSICQISTCNHSDPGSLSLALRGNVIYVRYHGDWESKAGVEFLVWRYLTLLMDLGPAFPDDL
jgi:hypothetical protein